MTALLLAAPAAAAATTYYVANGGNDGAAGTSPGAAWATLQHAADEVGPGDTVIVMPGAYAGMYLTTSGTPGARITFAGQPGAQITSENPTTPDGINLEGASHVTVQGFTVSGIERAGLRAVLCDEVRLIGNTLVGNGDWGILTGFCDDLLIEGNSASGSLCEHGIYVSNSGDRPTIRGNRVFGNNANGIHMNGDVFSQPGDGIISDALVEGNVIFDNGSGLVGGPGGCPGGGSGINMDGVQDSVIRNNLVYDAHHSGISLYRIDGGGPSSGNHVLHNTVHVASDGRWGLNVRDGSTGTTVRNNVLWSDHSFRGAMSVCGPSDPAGSCLPGFTSDGNAVEDRFTLDDGDTVLTLTAWRTATGQDDESFVAAPGALFVAPAAGDYHLKAGSPALEAGIALPTVALDLDGTPRPLGAGWDVGAYEGVGVIFADGFASGGTGRWSATVSP